MAQIVNNCRDKRVRMGTVDQRSALAREASLVLHQLPGKNAHIFNFQKNNIYSFEYETMKHFRYLLIKM